VTVGADGGITVGWHAAMRSGGSPVVGGGAVWAVDYSSGTLYALDPATGAVRQQLAVGGCPHFVSPSLAGDKAYIGTLSGVVAVSGA
jgi:outer membrane protein assembly factor BamB